MTLGSTVGVKESGEHHGRSPWLFPGNTKAQVNHLIDMGFDARARRDSNPQPSDP